MGSGVLVKTLVQGLRQGPRELRASLTHAVLLWDSGPEIKPLEAELEARTASVSRGGISSSGPREPLALPVKRDPTRPPGLIQGVTVGRTEDNDIVLPSRSVSRFHAYFQKGAQTEWAVVDAHSRNGTRLNDLPLAPESPRDVPDESALAFGGVRLTFMTAASFLRFLEALAARSA